MYEVANPHKTLHKQPSGKPKWLTVQELAFKDDEKSEQKLRRLVAHAERRSIKLPLVRVAREAREYKDSKGKVWQVDAGKTVILDIVSYTLSFTCPQRLTIPPHSSKQMTLSTKLPKMPVLSPKKQISWATSQQQPIISPTTIPSASPKWVSRP